MQRYKRNDSRTRLYKEAINKCCNPDCDKADRLETHHVQPLEYSGIDDFINYIVLCKGCHVGRKNHSDYDLRAELLFRWKFYAELMDIGYTADDYSSDDYRLHLRAAIKARRQVGLGIRQA